MEDSKAWGTSLSSPVGAGFLPLPSPLTSGPDHSPGHMALREQVPVYKLTIWVSHEGETKLIYFTAPGVKAYDEQA